MSAVMKPEAIPAAGGQPAITRQFVNFAYYKLDPAWRRLPAEERARQKGAFLDTVAGTQGAMHVYAYSTVGIRPDCDFMLWRIALTLEEFQDHTKAMNHTALGGYLSTPYSYLSMTKRSMYVDKHSHEGQESSRSRIVPSQSKYIFVYPFVKTREWYLLSKADRQRMMDEHIATGHKYPTVKINTTYSFGLDDQDFVVAFESDHPDDFLDLVQELRETEGSRHTVRDVPIFTCVKKPLAEVLEDLG